MRETQNPRRAPSSARTGLLAAALLPAALLPAALLLATLLVSRAHAQESSWNAIEPTAPGQQNVCVRIHDNEATYYLLDTKSPIEFSLRGPGKLRVLSRHLPIAGRTGKRCYTIRVDEDGKLVKAEPQLAMESESALLCDRSGTAGASAETIVSIPDGRHTYQVTVEEHGKAVAARF
ncbi:MAG: hypothetical protein V1774_12150, partial [Candidatus Eisenbacteria bacterium]